MNVANRKRIQVEIEEYFKAVGWARRVVEKSSEGRTVKLRARMRPDGRWCFVVRTKEGVALGTIYRTDADPLTSEEAQATTERLQAAGYEVETLR